MTEESRGKPIEVVPPEFEPGKPTGEGVGRWADKLTSRTEILRYLETGERYWYGKEWYGSERRSSPA